MMRAVRYMPSYIADKLDDHLKTVNKLLEMVVSDQYTHSQKRAIARTLILLEKQLNHDLVSTDGVDELPF